MVTVYKDFKKLIKFKYDIRNILPETEDYMNDHSAMAKQYEEMKRSLWKKFK